MITTHDAALAYAKAGWAVVPVQARDKAPRTDLAPHGAHSATFDENEIESWPWQDDINIGIALGSISDNLIVADLDDPNAVKAIASLGTELLTKVALSRTGKGMHLWIRTTGPAASYNLSTAQQRHIGSVRGDGQYVVAPPSVHSSGQVYKWSDNVPQGTLPDVPLVGDSLEFFTELFERAGIFIVRDLPDVDVPDNLSVIPQDIPEPLVAASGKLTMYVSMLSGSVQPSTGERSDRRYGDIYNIYYESLVHEMELALEQLAGISRALDDRYYGKFTGRNDRDKEHLRTAARVQAQKPDMMPGVLIARKNLERAIRPSNVTERVGRYWWDPSQRILAVDRGRNPIVLANFRPTILEEYAIGKSDEDTSSLRMRFELAPLEGATEGRRFEFILPAEERGTQRLQSYLTKILPDKFVIESGMHAPTIVAAQHLSVDWPERRLYAMTGWVEHDGERLFLLPGAPEAIGANGTLPDVRIDFDRLPRDEPVANPQLRAYGRQVRPPIDDDEIQLAWDAFAALIALGPADVTMITALQVLAGPLGPAGARTIPPLVHLRGGTGTFKTGLCKAALSIFGTFTGTDNAPTNWGTTANTIQMLLHTVKDLTLLVDDYKTSVVRNRGETTRLIQQYADGGSRGRMTRNQRFQAGLDAQGLMLSNGEDVWEREASAEARTITVHIREGDLHKEDLVALDKEHIETGYLQLFGGAFLRWLAQHPEYFARPGIVHEMREPIEASLNDSIDRDLHARLVASIASVAAVGQVVQLFVRDLWPEQEIAYAAWLRDAADTLRTGAREHGAGITESSPFRQLARAVNEAIGTHDACLWPGVGMSEHTQRIPAGYPNAEIVGYWFYDGADPADESMRTVLFTQATTYAWYKRVLRAQGELVGFSWTAVLDEALDTFGGVKRPQRVVRIGEGENRRYAGVEVPMSQFVVAAGSTPDA